jgi:RNA polymerase sigma-70 factor (ECF subfamily)
MTAPGPSDELPDVLLARARAGDAAARDRLLESYRNYLRVLARTQVDPALRARVDPSDLAQETLWEAHRAFAAFDGATERDLLAWLRRLLVRNVLDAAKRHRAGRRGVGRQESLEALLEQSCQQAEDALGRDISSPSAHARRREQSVLLADALARLPEDYREVLILRNLEHLPFEEVGRRMGRSSGAVRMLWARGLERLTHLMESDP